MTRSFVTWNPVTGCTPISAGCDHCYAKRMAERWQELGVAKYRRGFAVTLHPEVLRQPFGWAQPRQIFANSMSDLFHARVPFEFVEQIWDVIRQCPRHTFRVLTKRPERMARFTARRPAPANLWLGTSVEDARVLHRVDRLREVDAPVRFLSCEPLIGPLAGLDLTGIDWIGAGGESGPGCRPCQPEWVRALRDQCLAEGVGFVFKGWGGPPGADGGRLLDGQMWRGANLRLPGAVRQLALFDEAG